MQTVVFASPGGTDLLVDLYLPASETPTPAIIFLHGGGWQAGTRTGGPGFARYFAQDGFAMASIDYRLVPRIRFPANVEDVKTAVRWLRANAHTYNIDPDRIALWGVSAGGHLGAIAALSPPALFAGTDHLDQSCAVRCVFDGYGPSALDLMDRQAEAEIATLQKTHPALPPWPGGRPAHDDPKSVESRLIDAPLQSAPEKVRAANPLTYVTADAPPFMLMHGYTDDAVPRGQSVALYEALAKAGAEASLYLVDGLGHGFFNIAELDELAGPFRMDVRTAKDGTETSGEVNGAKVFDVIRAFFARHLL